MNGSVAVSDASPLIALNQIDRLDLLQGQFDRIVIPSAVEREIAPSTGAPPAWMHLQHVSVPRDYFVALDVGEREAIVLALQLNANFLVIADLPGRHTAERIGLRVIGTLGLLVRAKRRGLIRVVRPLMDEVIMNGLHVSDLVYREILALAGESSAD